MSKNLPLVKIYTDGGAAPNPGPGGWGAVVIYPADIKELSGGDPDTTNNRMELTAAIEALKSLPEPSTVEMVTDSQYVRNGITEWMPGWIKKGRLHSGDVQNSDLWLQLLEQTQRHDIRWQWVRGHTGNPYNERADELASAAIPHAKLETSADRSQVYMQIAGTESGKAGACGWAACIKRGDDAQYIQGGHPSMSINQFSVYAALEILRQIPPEEPIQVITTHSYLHDGITQWVNGWRKGGWVKPNMFKDLWQALDRENQARQITWSMLRRPEGETAQILDQLTAMARQARAETR